MAEEEPDKFVPGEWKRKVVQVGDYILAVSLCCLLRIILFNKETVQRSKHIIWFPFKNLTMILDVLEQGGL